MYSVLTAEGTEFYIIARRSGLYYRKCSNSWSSHCLVSDVSPMQDFPPSLGGGLLHSRLLVFFPWTQGPQEDQQLHPPSTPPVNKRDMVQRVLGEEDFRVQWAKLPTTWLLGEGTIWGLLPSLCSLRSPQWPDCLCTRTRIARIKASLTNFLQYYLKFVYYFTTVSKHFHMYFIIHLLLTRTNRGDQEVC